MKKILLFAFSLSIVFSAIAQWTPQVTGFSNVSTGIRYMHAVDEEIVWCTAYDGVTPTTQTTQYCYTLNGGTDWIVSEIPGYSGYGTSMIFALNGSIAWVPLFSPTGGGVILNTIDGGSTWTEQTTASFTGPAGFPNIVHFWDGLHGVCAGDPNGGFFEVYTTIDGGTTWTRVAQTDIPDPIATDEYGVTGYYSVVEDTIWYSTNKGRLYMSPNKGLSWEVLTTPIVNTQFKVTFRTGSHGIIYDNQSIPARIYETFDGGDTWAEILYNGPLYDVDICYVPGTNNTWISSGNANGVSFSYDGGHSWEAFANTTGMSFLATRFVSPTVGWSGDFTIDAFTGGVNKYTGNLQPMTDDVGVLSIDIPPLLEPGQLIPTVTFKNFGSSQQSFDVSFTISGVYTSIVPVINLDPFQTIEVEFDPWMATIGGYTVTVNTLLASDMNTANDFDEIVIEIMDLTTAYGYVAYDVTGNIAHGPAKIYLEAPDVIISLDNQVAENFVSAGTWGPSNKWFGAVFYDEAAATGGELIVIDPVTGGRSIVGFMGSETVHGLSYDFANSIMYATTYDGVGSFLYTVDLSDGTLTLIGSTNSDILINLACNSQGDLYAVEMVGDNFGKLNVTTGEFTPLFSIGFDASFAQDMEFDRTNDSCYMAAFNQTSGFGELHTVDISNSLVNYVGQFAYGVEITGFAIPFIQAGIYETNVEQMINIFPNPGSKYISINSKSVIIDYRIIDSKGSLLLIQDVNSRYTQVDVLNLPAGLYNVVVRLTDNSVVNKQFVKIK